MKNNWKKLIVFVFCVVFFVSTSNLMSFDSYTVIVIKINRVFENVWVCKWNCPKLKLVWQMINYRIYLNRCDLGKGLKKSVFARLFLHEIARLLRHDVSAFTALMNWNHPIKIHRFTMKKREKVLWQTIQIIPCDVFVFIYTQSRVHYY